MLTVKNKHGFSFCWADGSDIVEVFHSNASFPDEPLEAVLMQGPRSETLLKQLAFSTSEYANY